jgi:hypothetical protein
MLIENNCFTAALVRFRYSGAGAGTCRNSAVTESAMLLST